MNTKAIDFIKNIKKDLNPLDYIVFIIGYLLSPLSLYNDVIINIPLSSYLSYTLTTVFPFKYFSVSILFAFFYLLSNIVGIIMILVAVRNVKKKFNWKLFNKHTYVPTIIISIVLFLISFSIELLIFR